LEAVYTANAVFLQKGTLKNIRIVISSGSEKSLTIKIPCRFCSSA